MWRSMARFFNFRYDGRAKLRNRRLYSFRVLFVAAVILVVCLVVPPLRNREWVFGLLGVLGGVALFLFQQHQNETALFAGLFEKFNSRYNDMNERLQQIRASGKSLTDEDRLKIIDYFNLCAEEFLFYDAGYIDQRVWNAWSSGMRWYAEDPRFLEVWAREGGSETYYGFTFPPPL